RPFDAVLAPLRAADSAMTTEITADRSSAALNGLLRVVSVFLDVERIILTGATAFSSRVSNLVRSPGVEWILDFQQCGDEAIARGYLRLSLVADRRGVARRRAERGVFSDSATG